MKTIKKIGRFISAFFKVIIRFIDKKIVVPITKFILFLSEKTGKKTGKFEKWLTRKNTLVFISLLLSLGLFFVIDNKSLVLVDASAEVLYDQKVEAIYNSEDYVVEGLPETVDVTLIGRRVDLYLAKQLSGTSISVDLSNLKEGTHKVKLNYESSVNSINYKLDPSTVNVSIYPKLSENRTASIDIVNQDKLDNKLSVSGVEIDQKEIIIKGASHTISEVSSVKALVDVSKIVEPTVGVMPLDDVSLVAYDSKGNAVDVEMVPSKVTAKVSIESPNKEVPIKIIPKGEVLFGKAISSMSSNITKVTIYGKQSILDTIEFIPIEIDVTNLANTKEYKNVKIKKPSGINYMSQAKTEITVSLGNEESIEINDVYIETVNLDSNYKVVAIGENSSKTTVVVKGTKEVLDTIDSTTLKATIDLSGYGEGDFEVPVTVIGDDSKATYTSKTSKIKIRISKK